MLDVLLTRPNEGPTVPETLYNDVHVSYSIKL